MNRSIFRRALADCLTASFWIVGAGMLGFGSIARDGGFDLPQALAATAGIWGLPGQVALVDLRAAGADVVAVVLASSLANARFMPMSMTVMPLLRAGRRTPAFFYLLVHLISANTWVLLARIQDRLSPRERQRYILFAGLLLMAMAVLATAVGYLATAALPSALALALIYLGVLFYALAVADVRERLYALALLIGAPLGLAGHWLSPDWGLLATGLVGGSAAFGLEWLLARRRIP